MQATTNQKKSDNPLLIRALAFAGIHESRYATIQEYWFAKSVFIYSHVGQLLAIFYATLYWFCNAPAAAISLLLLLVMMIATFPLHRMGRTRLYAQINLAATNTALAGVVLHMGGIRSSVACWLLGVIPGLAALLFRRAKEIIYLTLYTFGLYCIVFILELNDYPVYQFMYPEGSLVERIYTFFNFSISALFSGMALTIFAVTQTRLYRELEHQSRDAKAILTNIYQGIFTIRQPDLRINADYSQHLEVLLDETDIENRNAFDLIFRSCQLSSDQIASMESILSLCIGESLLTFQLNQGSLGRELIYRTRLGEQKILLVDWQPVLDAHSDTVEKMLVTLRDVTELKMIQRKMSRQQDDIDMICDIVDMGDRFDSFLRSSQTFLEENRRLIDCMRSYDPEAMKVVFINLHTIKGVARSFHLRRITAAIHDCEHAYAAVQKGVGEWDQAKARTELRLVEEMFAAYDKVNREKLRRGDDGSTLKIDKSRVRENIRALQTLENKALDPGLAPVVDTMRATFYDLYYVPIEDIFKDICLGLPSLARDLRKDEPEVLFESPSVGITAEGSEVLQHVFIHFLRNSMDHGVETAEERQRKGKPPVGRLRFTVSLRDDGFLSICYEDDGQGLAFDKLRTAALQAGLWSLELEHDPQKLANLIFIQGFTTTQKISDISGRGMGMAAAAEHAEKIGGSVRIVLGDLSAPQRTVPFHHEVMLPPSVFVLYTRRPNAA